MYNNFNVIFNIIYISWTNWNKIYDKRILKIGLKRDRSHNISMRSHWSLGHSNARWQWKPHKISVSRKSGILIWSPWHDDILSIRIMSEIWAVNLNPRGHPIIYAIIHFAEDRNCIRLFLLTTPHAHHSPVLMLTVQDRPVFN